MLKNLPPRAFSDISVPLRIDGTPMLSVQDEQEFNTYVAWLADYLYTTEIPLHPRQEPWVPALDNTDPGTIVFEISDTFGYAVWDLDCTEMSFEQGEDWPTYDAAQRRRWMEDVDDSQKELLPYDDFAVDEATWSRLREEWQEEQAVPNLPGHADIPFRALLARVMRRVPERRKRIAMLIRYFQNFDENACK